MFSKFKKRLGVFTAIALMSALVPALSVSTASAAPATALAPHTNEDSSTYSACPTGSAPAAGFTDTTSTDVDCIAMYGITTGVTATTYEPSASIPRWQMALYLTRMASKAGVTLGSGADQGFTDISGYSAAIQTAINQIKQLGVTTGTTATTYSPDDNVTREQMAMFIERLLGQTATGQGGNADADAAGLTLYVNSSDTVTGNYNYDDIDSGSVTFEGHNAIVEMWQLGITGDLTTNRSYRPSAAMTRAEMATFVTNALGHTNVRPAGLWLQASKSAGFANTAPTLTASYRDSSHAAVSGKVIDFFEWQNAATTSDNSAHTATGACATATALTTNSLTKCKVEVGDPTTDTKGNIASFSESVTNAKTMSYFAWSAAAGTTFDLDLHGSGDDYSTINVSSSTPASVLLMSTNVNPYAAVGADPYPTTVKYGDSVTITAQMSAAKVGASWAAVAQPLNLVTFVHTIEAVAADTVESVTTTKVYTDANGTATYTFTDADPLATAGTGDTTHSIVVSNASGVAQESKAAAGYAGHFKTTGSTVEVDFTDDAIALTSSSMATNTTAYKAGSALLPVARSATMTLRDQYGNAHTASSGASVQFTGESRGLGRITATTHGSETFTSAGHLLAAGDKIVFTEIGGGAGGLVKEDCTYTVKTRTDHNNVILKVVAGDQGVGTVTGCAAADPFAIGANASGAGAGAWLYNTTNDTFGFAERTVGPDGTANIAWNDVTTTSGRSTVGGYVSAAVNAAPNKAAHRWLAPSATVLDNSKTSATWSETDAGGTGHLAEADNDINGHILAWDNANNTLLVEINYGTAGCSEDGAAAAAPCSQTFTQYTYDDNDQFNTTADVTAAAATMAGFEYQLGLHLAAGTGGLVFTQGDLASVTYQALSGNVSIFGLGT